jgi:WD40 repeat protein
MPLPANHWGTYEHDDDVSSAQFSRDGQRVVTASLDKTVRLWDAATSKSVGEPLKHEGVVSSAQFGPNSQRWRPFRGTRSACGMPL